MAPLPPAPATPPPLPAGSIEQRVAALEAYIANTRPDRAVEGHQRHVPVVAIDSIIGRSRLPGHNAWLLTSTALVLFMTLPGLALFYGGMVRRKNVLSVLAQCFLITGLVTILWVFVGYGMIFGGTGQRAAQGRLDLRLGRQSDDLLDAEKRHLGAQPNYSYWVSENVVAMFQLMFAIITPALIIGSIAERMKFKAIFVFMTLWMLIVYFTQGHAVWGINGYMNGVWNAGAKIHAMDFAGGTVVHMTSGYSALGALLDPRQAQRLRQRKLRAAQPGVDLHRHRHAVGRLVWFQLRQRAWRLT